MHRLALIVVAHLLYRPQAETQRSLNKVWVAVTVVARSPAIGSALWFCVGGETMQAPKDKVQFFLNVRR
jgi:hypothetical protein